MPVSDVEFVQFHPTMLYTGSASGRRPLITEALRGEGASLVDRHGEPVMSGVHPMGDLAPRDVVAAAIREARMSASGDACVYLDARHVADVARGSRPSRPPAVPRGIDPVRQTDSVVPCAHYSCGGVVTDVHGRTAIDGLYAAGSGPHRDARRESAGIQLPAGGPGGRRPRRRGCREHAELAVSRAWSSRNRRCGPVLARPSMQHTRMSGYASVVRDDAGLGRLAAELETAQPRILSSRSVFEDAALTAMAGVVGAAARARTETAGAYQRSDHPDTDPAQAVSIVCAPVASGCR